LLPSEDSIYLHRRSDPCIEHVPYDVRVHFDICVTSCASQYLSLRLIHFFSFSPSLLDFNDEHRLLFSQDCSEEPTTSHNLSRTMVNKQKYGAVEDEEKGEPGAAPPVLHSSFHSSLSPLLAVSDRGIPAFQKSGNNPSSSLSTSASAPPRKTDRAADEPIKPSVLYIIIYGVVNSIMAIPCIFGYAAVIFNNPVFNPYINELSKVVLWSSTVHQFCFTIFSSLPFAIGQVQDAGLIFLSHMSNTMADKIMADGGTAEEVMSTCLVLLSLATFSTGVILVIMGKFKLADLVSYLPLPVVGGYLACKLKFEACLCLVYIIIFARLTLPLQSSVTFVWRRAWHCVSPNQ
jgi:hypothetical protein